MFKKFLNLVYKVSLPGTIAFMYKLDQVFTDNGNGKMEKITVLQENNDQELVANHSPESAFNVKLRECFNNRHFLVHNRTIFSKRASFPFFI